MALDWLKPILGEGYTAEVDTQIVQEIGKGFVARADFNAKNEELKQTKTQLQTVEGQLDSLKTEGGDLTAKITALQEQNKQDKAQFDADIVAIRLDTAVDRALTEAGAKNNTAVKALLAGFLKDAKMKEDGTVRGLASEIETLTKAEGTAFLFKAADAAPPAPPQIQGMKPGEATHTGPVAGIQQHFEMRLADARKVGNNIDVITIKREAAESGIILT